MLVELIGNNGLPAFIDVYVFHGLLPRLVHPYEGLKCCTRTGLSLHGQPHVGL